MILSKFSHGLNEMDCLTPLAFQMFATVARVSRPAARLMMGRQSPYIAYTMSHNPRSPAPPAIFSKLRSNRYYQQNQFLEIMRQTTHIPLRTAPKLRLDCPLPLLSQRRSCCGHNSSIRQIYRPERILNRQITRSYVSLGVKMYLPEILLHPFFASSLSIRSIPRLRYSHQYTFSSCRYPYRTPQSARVQIYQQNRSTFRKNSSGHALTSLSFSLVQIYYLV